MKRTILLLVVALSFASVHAEPVFNQAAGDTVLWQDNFDRYSSIPAMTAPGARFGWPCANGSEGYQLQWYLDHYYPMTYPSGVGSGGDCNPSIDHPEFGLATGRNGSGKAIRAIVVGQGIETGVGWASPYATLEYYSLPNGSNMANYNGTLVMQIWFRLSTNAVAGDVGYKWFMAWNPAHDHREEVGVGGVQGNVHFGINNEYGVVATQPVGPYWDTEYPNNLADGQWHRWTWERKANTVEATGWNGITSKFSTNSSRDGFSRVWIDGTKIIDLSASACGITPPGGTRPWCNIAEVDTINSYNIGSLDFPGTLNDPPAGINWTVDYDDLQVWVEGNATGICEATGGAKCWYVDPINGDDTLGNGSFASPFYKPESAVMKAAPGDYIYLRGGTYGFSNAYPYLTAGWDTPGSKIYYAAIWISNGDGLPGWALAATGAKQFTTNSGTPTSPITVKSYPGEQAIIKGYPVLVRDKSYWRIQNLVVDGSSIGVGSWSNSRPHDIYIMNNEVRNLTSWTGDNPGFIRIDRGGGPYNIFVWNNTVHDFAACTDSTCTATLTRTQTGHMIGAVTTLSNQDYDGFDVNGTGYIEIINNTFHDIPNAFFFKNPAAGPIVIRGNTLYNTNMLGYDAASNVLMENNVVYNVSGGFSGVGRPPYSVAGIGGNNIFTRTSGAWTAGSLVNQKATFYDASYRKLGPFNVTNNTNTTLALAGDATTAVTLGDPRMDTIAGQNITIINNTFIGLLEILGIEGGGTGHHAFNNIIFGLTQRIGGQGTGCCSDNPAYIKRTYAWLDPLNPSQSTLQNVTSNNNCFITPTPYNDIEFTMRVLPPEVTGGATFVEHSNYTTARSVFGFDPGSVFIGESNAANVFTNPATNDYTLKPGSAAATQCSAMGAYATTQTDTTPPPAPGTPQVALTNTGNQNATYSITWTTSLDQPSGQPVPTYNWNTGQNTGSWTAAGTTNTNSLTIQVPYLANGSATTGYFCVVAVDTAGNPSTSSCNSFNVPAQPQNSSQNAGDLNDDGRVDFLDLLIVVGQFRRTGANITNIRADINGDNTVNLFDFVLLAKNWGRVYS